TVTYSSTKPESPADSASSITGTSPAPAIRLSSSNSAEKLWETRTTGAPVAQRVWDSRQVHSRWSQEHSALTTRPQQPHGQRIQLTPSLSAARSPRHGTVETAPATAMYERHPWTRTSRHRWRF